MLLGNNIKQLGLLMSAKQKSLIMDSAESVKYAGLKQVKSNVVPYSRKHRSQWFKPEYDFKTLQIAEHTDGILLRAIKKKADRILVSGFEFVGADEDPVHYIVNRIKQIELVSGKPFELLVRETAADIFRQNNCMWTKVRSIDSSSGEVRTDLAGNELQPVAAYYILPFGDLEFKTKLSGEFKKIKQNATDGTWKEYSPQDVIHFYTDKKPGFTVGTPELLPALDDISLLRRIEENVEELIETNLFPSFHYKIGSDAFPERWTPDGVTESQLVKQKIEYMPAGSVYVSDHRHEITAIGSEGKALVIDNYLDYFRKRAIASAGTTEVDLGIEGGANRSTANTLSKAMIMDIEAVQRALEIFINHEVIQELLLEGGYDPFKPEDRVEIKFGIIDREERIALENQQIQMFTNNVRNLDEVRKTLGDKPVDDTWFEHTFYKLFEEPLAMIKASGMPGSAPAETLATVPHSNVTPEAVNKSKAFAIKQQKAGAASKASAAGKGRPASKASSGKRTSTAKSKPSNQHGTRSSPKLSRDINLNLNNETATIQVDQDLDQETIDRWISLIEQRYDAMSGFNVSLQSIADNLIYRLSK